MSRQYLILDFTSCLFFLCLILCPSLFSATIFYLQYTVYTVYLRPATDLKQKIEIRLYFAPEVQMENASSSVIVCRWWSALPSTPEDRMDSCRKRHSPGVSIDTASMHLGKKDSVPCWLAFDLSPIERSFTYFLLQWFLASSQSIFFAFPWTHEREYSWPPNRSPTDLRKKWSMI